MNNATDLRQRCDKAIELMVETGPPLYIQVNNVLEVFNKLTLDESQKKNERVLTRHFAQINARLAKYDIQTTEDYRKMSIDDLYSILLIIRKMIDKLELL